MGTSTEQKIPLIYILSNGRSGSTLLDILLGSHPEVWTLGEAQILPWELKENRMPCGCGSPVAECEFWSRIIPKIPIGEGSHPIEHFRDRHGGGKVLRWGILSQLATRRQGKTSRAEQEYGRLNAEYFREVWREADVENGKPVRWLVDASKDPYRLLWLQNSGLFDIRVIHLMKDPRAFVYSMVRRGEASRLRMGLRMTGRWLIENSIFSYVCRKAFPEGQTLRIRYEHLAGETDEALESIGSWLGIDLIEQYNDESREKQNHGISGNLMRWNWADIQLDDRWRRELPQWFTRSVWALTWPVALVYGYR